MVEVPFAAQGYGSYFALSLFDRRVISNSALCICLSVLHFDYSYHNPDASLEEGLDVLKRAIKQVQKRLIVGLPNWKVKVVDKDGARVIDLDLSS